MRNPSTEEVALLDPMLMAMRAAKEAFDEARARYEQAVNAVAFACQVPPRGGFVLNEAGWEWCVIVATAPDGSPVMRPALQPEPVAP